MSARLQTIHAWLDSVLDGAPYGLAPASEDASFRRYFRVTLGDCTRVLMDAPPEHEDCRPFVAVAELLERAGVTVPVARGIDYERGLLLLDDLGSTLYLDRLDDDSADRLYEDALDALVRMQRAVDPSDLPVYDRDRLRAEMMLFPDWFLARHLGSPPDAADRLVLEQVFDFLVAENTAQPQAFVHRDYHSRNLMVLEHGNPGVIDFQDAVSGPLTYDLVSLLRDAYVAWPERRVYGWVARYRELAVAAGLPVPDAARLVRDFDLMGVQRHLKVAGIFARLFHRDGKTRYLADIPLVLDYLLGVARRYEELEPLVQLCDRFDVRAAACRASDAATARCGDAG